MTTTDTPRTDACPHCGAEELEGGIMKCHSYAKNHTNAGFRSMLCREREKSQKLEAEVEEIRSALGDDGRRTHKEILELAFKASQWREWKQKYIDLRNAHIAEGQDPAGTIWEHADKIQQELKASKAEVERLTKRPFGCKCETLREKVLGDGCDECNKTLVIEMLTDERDELEAEVERLGKLLFEGAWLQLHNC